MLGVRVGEAPQVRLALMLQALALTALHLLDALRWRRQVFRWRPLQVLHNETPDLFAYLLVNAVRLRLVAHTFPARDSYMRTII